MIEQEECTCALSFNFSVTYIFFADLSKMINIKKFKIDVKKLKLTDDELEYLKNKKLDSDDTKMIDKATKTKPTILNLSLDSCETKSKFIIKTVSQLLAEADTEPTSKFDVEKVLETIKAQFNEKFSCFDLECDLLFFTKHEMLSHYRYCHVFMSCQCHTQECPEQA